MVLQTSLVREVPGRRNWRAEVVVAAMVEQGDVVDEGVWEGGGRGGVAEGDGSGVW